MTLKVKSGVTFTDGSKLTAQLVKENELLLQDTPPSWVTMIDRTRPSGWPVMNSKMILMLCIVLRIYS